jgi:uncharacterized membrane protein YgcG
VPVLNPEETIDVRGKPFIPASEMNIKPAGPVPGAVAEPVAPPKTETLAEERARRAAGKPPRPIVLPEDPLVGTEGAVGSREVSGASAEPVPPPGQEPNRQRLGEEWARQYPQAEAKPAEAVPPPPEGPAQSETIIPERDVTEPGRTTAPPPPPPAANRPNLAARAAKALIRPSKGKVIAGVIVGGAALRKTQLDSQQPSTSPPPPPPPAGTVSGGQVAGDTPPAGSATATDKRFPGVSVRVDPTTGAAVGVTDENGVYHNFPDDLTDDEYDAVMQAVLHNKEAATVHQVAPVSPPEEAPDVDTSAADYVPPPEGKSISPGSVGTPVTEGTTPAITASGDIPLIAPDGTNTGLVLTKDGDVKKTGGGGDYSSGGSSYRSGGSSYRSGGYSSGGYSRKKKKKKTSSSSGTSGMWPGFPFNRPPSPIRQQILDAIAASKAKGAAKKGG